MKYQPLPDSSSADHPPPQTWRPWSLRRRFLVSFGVLSALLCIAIEFIVVGCDGGCHVFGALSSANHSRLTQFTYNQLPTIIGLALSLIWALPHHNILRLEPYFQMSAPGGATAAQSIFLKYPYIFALFVPYAALRRGHVVVLISSCIALSVNFLITPLISGIFDDRQFSTLVHVNGTRAILNRQSGVRKPSSSTFAHVVYDYTWLNGTLPPFTTPEYMVLPIRDVDGMGVGTETWAAETTLFEAEFTCENAVINNTWHPDVHGASLDIQSSANSSTRIQICDAVFQLQNNSSQHCDALSPLITPWTSISHEFSVTTSGIHQPTYLYAWVSGPNPAWEIGSGAYPPAIVTAIFCTAHYYSQNVTANITMPEGIINSVNRTGIRKPFALLDLSGVITGARDPFESPDFFGFGARPAQVPSVDSHLRRRLGERPDNLHNYFARLSQVNKLSLESHSAVYMPNTQALPGHALAGRTLDNIGEFHDPERLTQEYQSVLKLWFAVAMAVDMVDAGFDAPVRSSVPVTRSVLTRGFIVDRTWASAAEIVLAAVVTMSMLLAVLIGRRPCMLDGEPNSLAEALRLLDASPEVCATLENAEFYSPNQLRKVFEAGGGKYALQLVHGHEPRIQPISVEEKVILQLVNSREKTPKPWMKILLPLRPTFGVGCVSLFALVLGLLITAFVHARKWDGLPTFAPLHSFRYKILFTYLPIAMGMATEPVLIAIGTCLAMMAPYTLLSASPAASPNTLALDFDKSPLHFQLFSSLRTSNIRLSAISTTILLTNVLAVALAGLFSSSSRMFSITTAVPSYATPTFRGHFTVPAVEMYFVLDGILSGRATTPAWTSQDYYILPLDHLPGSTRVSEYEVFTLGIGVDIHCDVIPPNATTLDCADKSGDIECLPRDRDFSRYINVVVDDPCWPKNRLFNSTLEDQSWWGPSRDIIIRSVDCTDTIFAIWVEQPVKLHPETNAFRGRDDLFADRVDGVILKCTTVDKVDKLKANMNIKGQPILITNIGSLDRNQISDLYSPNATGTLSSSFYDMITTGLWTDLTKIKTDTVWLNYLIGIVEPQTVRRLPNATRIPDPTYLAMGFEDVYRRLFATNLKLYADKIIVVKEKPQQVSGRVVENRDRVIMNSNMFYTAAAILVTLIAALIVIYWGHRQPIGYVPNSLAGMYALLYASNAKEICGKITGWNPERRAGRLEELEEKYVYGPFVSQGQKHYGVYRDGMEGMEKKQ